MDRGLHLLLLTALATIASLPEVAAAQAAGEPAALPTQQPQVVEPAVKRRDVEPAAIDTENFEAGAFVGTVSIEDFGSLEGDLKKSIRKGLKLMCRESQMGVAAAQRSAYALVDRLCWPGMQFRRDIGWRAIARPSTPL